MASSVRLRFTPLLLDCASRISRETAYAASQKSTWTSIHAYGESRHEHTKNADGFARACHGPVWRCSGSDLFSHQPWHLAYATSINDNGQIAGYSSGYSSAGYQVFNAFLYSGDSMTGLGLSDSRAFGINNSGQVVGHSGGQAFLYSGGNVTYLGGGLAYDINDDGQVVGYAITSGNPAPQQAFLYSGGGMSILGGGSSYSNAFGINDSGQIVGDTDSTAIAYNDPGLFGSMLYVGGGYTGGGGVTLSAAHAINNSGQIAGNYSTSIPDGQNNSTQVTRALFFDGSSTIDLGAQSSVYYDPLGGMQARSLPTVTTPLPMRAARCC